MVGLGMVDDRDLERLEGYKALLEEILKLQERL